MSLAASATGAVWYAHKSGNLSANDVFYDDPTAGNAKDVSAQGDATTVLSANSYAIAVDENLAALRISTADEDGAGAGAAGGQFTVNAARTITADIVAGTSICLGPTGSGYTLTINAPAGSTHVLTGGSGTNCHGLYFTGALTINITGNVIGGAGGNAGGATNAGAAGILNIAGNVSGGAGAFGVGNYSTGTVNITGGNISGGTASEQAYGIRSLSTGVVTLTNCNIINGGVSTPFVGNVIYNPGPTNYVSYLKPGGGSYKYGKTIPAADVLAGVNGDGALAPATGTCVVPAASDVRFGAAVGVSPATGTCHVPNPADVQWGVAVETSPTAGSLVLPAPIDVRMETLYGNDGEFVGECSVPGVQNVLYGVTVSAYNGSEGTYHPPAASDVRYGAAVGTTTGTCHVPSPANVLSGVLTDGTTGTYVTVPKNKVKRGVKYGAGSAITGTYGGGNR
jgi:hypothetical protein